MVLLRIEAATLSSLTRTIRRITPKRRINQARTIKNIIRFPRGGKWKTLGDEKILPTNNSLWYQTGYNDFSSFSSFNVVSSNPSLSKVKLTKR
ncbi:hypothetical protein GIB67_015051 [Kingdonia uniflora]|uniref:Uncharacterized protein n=1 Tax=Kingdonia uniflora TaxID=39325 RepID=A0A7J7NNE6_9MAGN|nr:hypothetical protein GIB67_015051 [Kingdonia uniflora]